MSDSMRTVNSEWIIIDGDDDVFQVNYRHDFNRVCIGELTKRGKIDGGGFIDFDVNHLPELIAALGRIVDQHKGDMT